MQQDQIVTDGSTAERSANQDLAPAVVEPSSRSELHRSVPCLDVDAAANLAATYYGIQGKATPLPSERDQNFRIDLDDGRQLVLKVANAAEDQAILALQNETMAFLSHDSQGGDASVPTVLPTLAGERLQPVRLGDAIHFVRLLTYLPGQPLATVRPQSPALRHSLGAFFGAMDRRLAAFEHPAATRWFHWDLQHADQVVAQYVDLLSDEHRALVEHFLAIYQAYVQPHLPSLRKSVIHSDGNDYNVLVQFDETWTPNVTGVIDFGDMVHSHTVNELAIAAAYAMLDRADPLSAAAQVAAGYHSVNPLTEDELRVLFGLMAMRLCVSVCLAAHQQAQAPDNEYLSISQAPAWRTLTALRMIHPRHAWYVLRAACDLTPCPQTPHLVAWLARARTEMAPIVPVDLGGSSTVVLDLSVGSALLAGSDVTAGGRELNNAIAAALAQTGAEVGLGRYGEARLIYAGEQFACQFDELPERRTVHLGVDLFMAAGTPVHAPWAGVVVSIQHNDEPLDYGPTLIVRHESPAGPFYTLYGHLGRDVLDRLQAGQRVDAGQQIGVVGDTDVNGGWPPHLHLQVITDLLGEDGNFPGVAGPSQRAVWMGLSPDPSPLLGLAPGSVSPQRRPADEIVAMRQRNLGRSLSISYSQPLHMVRGWRQFLYDVEGRAYLDVVNNVCHVGHCHPHVVQAGQRQMAVLNTNTRYLHDNIVDYADRLLATFPEPLSVVFFVCSGSEANELALRMARTYTGRQDVLMLDAAYHGNTQALIDISPYKHAGAGGRGAPDWAHVVTMPDPYRGRYRGDGPEIGRAYADHVKQTLGRLDGQGRAPAAFIAESVLGCGGQIVLPDGYLANAYAHMRAVGGVCIADEVQVGFGRVGSHFWAFETQGVVPDIVTLGKPIGNGHPLGAVVTTPAIADAFANGMEYFNTFGGNPVSCAIGMAVLDVIENEGLQANALQAGQRLMDGLTALASRNPLIGDVRGLGLFVGAELVLDPAARTPAPRHAAYIADRMRDHGILISTDGPDHNVLKLKPPIVFDAADADRLTETLDRVLQEECLHHG